MANELKGLRVAILATDDFEQAELTEPRRAFDEAGAETVVIAPKKGKIQGFKHDVKGDMVNVDRVLGDVSPDDFDALHLPGGALNADALRVVPEAKELVRKFNADKKPISVICHAPWLLISAGVVKGRTLTSYHTIQDDLKNAGAQWVDKEVVRDGNWVSSRKPDDIPAFNREAIKLFAEARQTAGAKRTGG